MTKSTTVELGWQHTSCLVIEVLAVPEHAEDLLRSVGRDQHVKDGDKACGVALQVLGVPGVRTADGRHPS